MMFVDCPAYLDPERTVRCGLPAEVRCRFTVRSTDGPLDGAMIRCPAGHYCSGPIESLTWDGKDTHDPGTAGAVSRAGRDSLQGPHDGRDGRGGSALRDFPARPEQNVRRPNSAPAYYLGRPARVWITAFRPRRSRTPSHHVMEAVTGGGERTLSRCGSPFTSAGAGTACLTPTAPSLPVPQAR
jgi:hypothetical protein